MRDLIIARDNVPARRLGALLRRLASASNRGPPPAREALRTLSLPEATQARVTDVVRLVLPLLSRPCDLEVGDLDPSRDLVNGLRGHVKVAVGQVTETCIGPTTRALRSLGLAPLVFVVSHFGGTLSS